jgi:AIPR protein
LSQRIGAATSISFNNGITAICTKFLHNALQAENWEVTIKGLQIVNGGQTCKTIQRTLEDYPENDYSKTFVLLRLCELSADDDSLINNITFATNSQNPVDLTDLRSNEPIQETLAIALKDLGYEYKRKRDEQTSTSPDVITSSVAAEAVMAVWKRKPNAAKFRRSRLFSELYDEVFSPDLQASHVILSVLAFRMVESERKRRGVKRAKFVPYGSHFLAMVVGDLLLEKAELTRDQVTHTNIGELRESFEKNKTKLYNDAVKRVSKALKGLGIKEDTPLPRVAAQFRRGDLLEPLQKVLSLK